MNYFWETFQANDLQSLVSQMHGSQKTSSFAFPRNWVCIILTKSVCAHFFQHLPRQQNAFYEQSTVNLMHICWYTKKNEPSFTARMFLRPTLFACCNISKALCSVRLEQLSCNIVSTPHNSCVAVANVNELLFVVSSWSPFFRSQVTSQNKGSPSTNLSHFSRRLQVPLLVLGG